MKKSLKTKKNSDVNPFALAMIYIIGFSLIVLQLRSLL